MSKLYKNLMKYSEKKRIIEFMSDFELRFHNDLKDFLSDCENKEEIDSTAFCVYGLVVSTLLAKISFLSEEDEKKDVDLFIESQITRLVNVLEEQETANEEIKDELKQALKTLNKIVSKSLDEIMKKLHEDEDE